MRLYGRRFPVIPARTIEPRQPISFVVVRLSDEYEHNLMASPCVHRPLNQLIVVDNTSNLHYKTLSKAINAGLEKATSELVVLVHQDTYLPDGWHVELTLAIEQLEQHDPDWGVVGTAGLTASGQSVGHYSGPHGYCATFAHGERFTQVSSVDEHILVLRRSLALRADEFIPGIHGIGTDLVLTATSRGHSCYVVDAPTIHKYRDASGRIIRRAMDSPQMSDRLNYAYEADKACCDEYISHKWDELTPFSSPVTRYEKWQDPSEMLADVPRHLLELLDTPVILLAKGGGGSRLLSLLAQDCGLFLGNDLNTSGDCVDMVMGVYQAVIEKYKCDAEWQKQLVVPQLRLAAARMLMNAQEEKRSFWGFKLPENLLLLPEFSRAFPKAKYIHMLRNPVSTCLRRTHMTARLDNQIGRVTLPLAYEEAGLGIEQILDDPPAVHMAYSTRHQLGMAIKYCRSHFDESRYREIRFEDVIEKSDEVLHDVSVWLGRIPGETMLAGAIDVGRATRRRATYSDELEQRVTEILAPLPLELGYCRTRN